MRFLISKKFFALVLAFVMAFSVTAFAANTTYREANGTQKNAENTTAVTESDSTWATGWYVAEAGDITIDGRVAVNGDVNLILADGANLTIDGGIRLTVGNSLTVWAQSSDAATMGKLTATATEPAHAGIGGNESETAGSITVNGGNITATGGTLPAPEQSSATGAGIGGGARPNTGDNNAGNGGIVVINGGFVTATGGFAAANFTSMATGAGIGGGGSRSDTNPLWVAGNGGTVTITGGTVIATGGGSPNAANSFGAGIGGGGGSIWGTGASASNSGSGGNVTITGGNVTAASGNAGQLDRSGRAIGAGGPATNHGTLTLNGSFAYRSNNSANTVPGGDAATATFANVTQIFNSARFVSLEKININGNISYVNANGISQSPVIAEEFSDNRGATNFETGWYLVSGSFTNNGRINISGDVHFILADNSNVTFNGGIRLAEGNSLTIWTQSIRSATMGKLTATATSPEHAGIGGNGHESAGSITINGGNITAIGGTLNSGDSATGAGIGGGARPASGGNNAGNGGTVVINGGFVTATGGFAASDDTNVATGAGIGGGGSRGAGASRAGNGGTVTITGGTVVATGGGDVNSQNALGAGIGGGGGSASGTGPTAVNSGSGGNVTITGGNVTAARGAVDLRGGGHALAIGGGGASTNHGTLFVSGEFDYLFNNAANIAPVAEAVRFTFEGDAGIFSGARFIKLQSTFGKIPDTGVFGMNNHVAAMIALIFVSAGLWAFVLRRKTIFNNIG
ncbi:MAG: hypothetical protein FWD19_02345 [Defluviitaleaceae bacterium]|nr:hypothetical protein [Defluviitaleaceae bacterium]